MTEKKNGRSRTYSFGRYFDAAGVETGVPIEVRVAWPNFHEKRTKSAGGATLEKPRHDAVIMVPKLAAGGDCPNYRMLCAYLMEAATMAWGSWPVGYAPKIADGDIPYRPKPKPGAVPKSEEQIIADNEWRKGHWIIEVVCGLDVGPKVYALQNGQMVEIPAKIVAGQELYKSGDYGYVSMNAWTFEREGNFGVNFGFDGFCFTRPGERIGKSGTRSATQMFGGVAAAPSVPGMPMPAAPAAPPVAPAAAPPPGAVMAAPPAMPAAPVPPAMPQYAAPPVAPAAAMPMPGAVAAPPPPPPAMPPLPAR